jgi:hypothetical protein
MKKNAILYISAILLVTASCSIKETPILEESPVQRNKIVTLVATLSPKGGNETKALTDPGDGTLSATWAINEEICVEYTNESDDFVDAKAIVTDVDGSGKATITVNLVNPKDGNSDIYFHYPYTIAKGIKENKLDQNGTLDDIATNFDDLTGEGTFKRLWRDSDPPFQRCNDQKCLRLEIYLHGRKQPHYQQHYGIEYQSGRNQRI